MKQRSIPRRFALAALAALLGASASPVRAHESEPNEPNDPNATPVSFEVRGPIDALSCDTTPPTVTVLGLAIDTTHAVFAPAPGSDDAENEDDDGMAPVPAPPMSCSDLAVGQGVAVQLVNDTPPLAATQLKGARMGDVRLAGPIQMTDPNAQTLTLFGLTIDASTAVTGGFGCGEGQGGDGQGEDAQGEDHFQQPPTPVDLTQLGVGQFVVVRLDPTRLPALVATRVDLQSSGDEVEVELQDQDGQDVEDGSDSVQVTVDQKVTMMVQTTVHGVPKLKHMRRALHFQMATNGSFSVRGLAKGRATIRVTRSVGGQSAAGRGVATVHPNQITSVKLRLRPVHGR
jgi:hypothetical protein